MIDWTRELHQRETLIPILGNWKGGITSGFFYEVNIAKIKEQ